jgi:hypothetical protein
MTAISASNDGAAPQPGGGAHDSFYLFGVPIGSFSLFATALISLALGFMAFFGTTFVSIFALMIYNRAGGHHVTLDMSYKFIALPVGVFVLIVSFAALFTVWLRRKFSGR